MSCQHPSTRTFDCQKSLRLDLHHPCQPVAKSQLFMMTSDILKIFLVDMFHVIKFSMSLGHVIQHVVTSSTTFSKKCHHADHDTPPAWMFLKNFEKNFLSVSTFQKVQHVIDNFF